RLFACEGAAHRRRADDPARPVRPEALPMTAQIALSILMGGVLLYAGNERRRSPVVAWLAIAAALAGLYFTWMPEQATWLAHWTGIGGGVDLVLYVWVCIPPLVLLNLHLKFGTPLELV